MNKESRLKETKEVIKFVRGCLKDSGYSKELTAYLFSTYDLESFINSFEGNHLEISSHFLAHAGAIDAKARNY